jgi:hypothetical protein
VTRNQRKGTFKHAGSGNPQHHHLSQKQGRGGAFKTQASFDGRRFIKWRGAELEGNFHDFKLNRQQKSGQTRLNLPQKAKGSRPFQIQTNINSAPTELILSRNRERPTLNIRTKILMRAFDALSVFCIDEHGHCCSCFIAMS